MRAQLTRSWRSRKVQSETCRRLNRKFPSPAVTIAVKSAARGLITPRVVARPVASQSLSAHFSQKAYVSTAAMAEEIKRIITPDFLAGIRDFWFEHIEDDESLVLPDQKLFMPWFSGGEFDKRCVEKYHPALDSIKASGITSADDLLKIVEPRSPFDWLSLVLLLDQMPRNCYRGAESKIVFNYFDPISLGVAQAAAAKDIPNSVPEIRWFLCRRIWFNLPFTHSESHEMHEKAMEGCERLQKDLNDLIEKPEVEGQDELRARAAQILKGNGEKLKAITKLTVDSEKEHFDIIKKFGRYPHRNKPLGREPTAAETEFLANGGATFAPPPPATDS